jgi:predicted nuclease of predicted toxin-antitoxin system
LKLLLDQGLPRTAAARLRDRGLDAVHTGEVGLAAATDEEILAFALGSERVVATLDADFHALLVRAGAEGPSVIRLRIDRPASEPLAELLADLVDRCREDLAAGAMISTDGRRVRVRRLPLVRRTGDRS